MRRPALLIALPLLSALLLTAVAPAADQAILDAQKALLQSMEIKPGQLRPLLLDTPLVLGGKAQAVICLPEEAAWRVPAQALQTCLAEATGVSLPLVTANALSFEQADAQNVLLVGTMNNNRHIARLYHNFLVCLDNDSAGRTGYELRTVHDPFGAKHNYVLVSGSTPEGAGRAVERLAALVKGRAQRGELTVGRLLEVSPEPTKGTPPTKMTDEDVQKAIAAGVAAFRSPGQGRTGASRVVSAGLQFHRTGDPQAGAAFKGLLAALLDYYRTDPVINGEGMARYDNDFRDAWTYEIALLWDLTEESGLFSDQERLDYTNLVLRLGLECVLYQGWDKAESIARWAANRDIVHNHNTFPALGVLFAGNYFKRHYGLRGVDDWLTVAHGIFNGQKHSSKPLEDAAGYLWLPVIHTMIYSLSQGDLAYFEEGHARKAAAVAVQVMDSAGYQAAFGDHTDETSASGIPPVLRVAGWYYGDPGLLWAAALTGGTGPLGQQYSSPVRPRQPADHVGLRLSYLPRQAYDYLPRSPQYPTAPNVPFEQTFDKLTLRAGWERDSEYLLLDGFGRGGHMHFDANAILRYSRGGEPVLVDGEYIKNAPKYHSSLVILRDGQSELTPAVAGLGRADDFGDLAYTRTYLTKYNGSDWARTIVWRPGSYLLVSDGVTALSEGDFTLRCCWRPWGEVSLSGGTATVTHPPLKLAIQNADGAACSTEVLKAAGTLPVCRVSQQVSRHLKPGESYRFVNTLSEAGTATAAVLGEGLIRVATAAGPEVVALGAAVATLPGLQTDAEMALLGRNELVLSNCRRLAAGGEVLSAGAPLSLRVVVGTGAGSILASEPTELRLGLPPGQKELRVGGEVLAAPAGVATVKLRAGRTELPAGTFALAGAVGAAHGKLAALPALAATAAETTAAPPAASTWEYSAFEAAPQPLKVAEVRASVEPKTPLPRLVDGGFQNSAQSTSFPAGKTVTIDLQLPAEEEIRAVVVREWHMNPAWDIADRQLAISSDGFKQDVRTLAGPFQDQGTVAFGGNVNTLMGLPVGQKARQLRFTFTPAREDANVYLAEIELVGSRPGVTPELRALATGDLDGDGTPETVCASGYGQVVALDGAGKSLWSTTLSDHVAVNALSCFDTDGDGKAEVVYGAGGGRLGVLGAGGKTRWEARPPVFRGIGSDVITVFPADINGDQQPEIGCGCASWQYFVYDREGKQLWRNVIYAHSATVGQAADLDRDGKDELIAGNVYYRLNVIDDNGQRLWATANIGPEMTAVAAANLDADPELEVVAGTDGGAIHCFDTRGEPLWQSNLGEKVTRVLPLDVNGDGKQELVCSAESAHVFALRADGSILWRTPLPDGAGDLAVWRQGGRTCLVAAAGTAGVVLLDSAGKVLRRAATAGAASKVVVAGDLAVVTTAQGKVQGWRLAER